MNHENGYCVAYEEVQKVHRKLDEQHQSLGRLVTVLENQTETLIQAVTGKKHVPILSHLIVVAALTTVIFVLLIKDSDKNLKVDSSGFSLGASQNK